MLEQWITFSLTNFTLVMFDLAVVFIILHRLIVGKALRESEIIFRWMVLFGLGFSGIYTFIVHAFFQSISAQNVGWAVSPFQTEVAMANLAFGVLGILSFKASLGFRLATTIGSVIWLWGDAINHIYLMVQSNNYHIGNAGSWMWMDIIIPLLLLVSVLHLRQGK